MLSKLGYCSRSQANALIRQGRVALRGRIVRDPDCPVASPRDQIEVDGQRIHQAPAIYLVMNKPRGVVTTASDEKGRAEVYDLLDSDLPWVGPVGRLDKASEGLLLLTNDTEWAAMITNPSSHLGKIYHVQVGGMVDAGLLANIVVGHSTKGGTAPGKPPQDLLAKDARLLRHGDKNSWLEITLDEGKNRQIRRLLESLGIEVLRLVRVSIGPLELGDLQKGCVRRLTAEEKRSIDRVLRGT